MRGGLCKERAGGAAPVGVRERTRCSRRQSPPSSPSRAGGTQLVEGGGGESEAETRESRGPRAPEGERIHSGIRTFSHTRCGLKSLMASTCCPRERRRSNRRGGRVGGLLPRRSPESHISTRTPQISQPVCTLQPHVSCPPSFYLRPRAPPFSTLFPSSSFSHHRVRFASRM